ncbi:MAG: metallophosphoesterase [Desulfobacterales bacterium]|jgi:UDP-2,3-diacylglucosamine pyrophosphatase LpxH|nr:metallophosphoesterase [Desulfobacterales bacterium]
MSVQTFHELHVVSDLHFGGQPGFQIFRQGDTLASFIRKCAQPSDRKIGVVFNGDIVDFLAEAPAVYLDPQNAIDKLERIFYEDVAFSGAWSALQEYVAQPNRQLILVLGNHDVELALPHVTEWILEKLSRKDSAARGRVTTCFDGAGFPCSVGNKRVFCIHGNDVDIWNMVDHKQLLDLAFAINTNEEPPEWDPNAGTRMVIDVMNAVKRDYPIVDLLKPEVEAVVPILLTLDPGRLKEIAKILSIAAYLTRDIVRNAFEGVPAENEMVESPVTEKEVMAEFFNKYFEYQIDESTETQTDEELPGPLDYLPAFFSSKKKKVEKLRKALKNNLEGDQSFEITQEDKMFDKMKKEIGSNINYLITGHSHKERAIARKAPDCYYFNSGTWIRLIRLTEDVLGNSDEFARVYAAFESGSMEQLDAINDLGPSHDQPLVMLRPTVVSIVEKDGETYGELRHANPDGSLKPVENTRLPAN